MQPHPDLATPIATPSIGRTPPTPRSRQAPRRMARSWQVGINASLAAILILGLGIGIWRQFGPSTPLPWQDGSPGNPNALIPAGTSVATDTTTSSSFPYPNGDECTVTPFTKDEARMFFETANVATPPPNERYERAITPATEDSAAIMSTFRMWQACTLSMWPMAYSLPLITPWYFAQSSPWFRESYADVPDDARDKRPVSDRTIDFLTSIAVVGETESSTIAATYADLFPTPTTYGTPMTGQPDVTYVPFPESATPIASPEIRQGRSFPSIFAKDITIIGPDRASALVYAVNEFTGEVMPTTPWQAEFIKVDGHWLLNDYHEVSRG